MITEKTAPPVLTGIKLHIFQCSRGCWHLGMELHGRSFMCMDNFSTQDEAEKALSEWWPSTLICADGTA